MFERGGNESGSDVTEEEETRTRRRRNNGSFETRLPFPFNDAYVSMVMLHLRPITTSLSRVYTSCVCVCLRVYWAVIEDVMQHRGTRMRLQRQVCDIGIDLLEIKDSGTRIRWG